MEKEAEVGIILLTKEVLLNNKRTKQVKERSFMRKKMMISLMMTVAMGTVMISGATVVKRFQTKKKTVKLAGVVFWSKEIIFRKGADEFNKRQDKINFCS